MIDLKDYKSNPMIRIGFPIIKVFKSIIKALSFVANAIIISTIVIFMITMGKAIEFLVWCYCIKQEISDSNFMMAVNIVILIAFVLLIGAEDKIWRWKNLKQSSKSIALEAKVGASKS